MNTTNPATDLDLLLSYARSRGAHSSVISMIESAQGGSLDAQDAADQMWSNILRSPAREELLGQLVARPTGAASIL